MKNIRIIHTSLNYKRKQHIFNIFKQKNVGQKNNSPFEFKDFEVDQLKIKNNKNDILESQIQEKQVGIRANFIEKNDDEVELTLQGLLRKKQQRSLGTPAEFEESSLVLEKDIKKMGGIQKQIYQPSTIKRSVLPPFQQLDDGLIHQYTMYSKNIQLHSPYRWTPYLQVQDIDDREFQLKMKYFRMKKVFEISDEAELIDTFIFKALKETGFDYYYDYNCKPSIDNPFHGKIDFLVYNRELKVPFIPILRARKEKNLLGEWEDKFNQAELVGAALWALTNMKAQDPNITVCRAIHTNGNKWRMIEISESGKFEKTHLYLAENDEFNRIYKDSKAQSVILGLIRFALNQPTEKETALKKIYDFIDEKKYLTDLDVDTKKKLDQINQTYFFLPKFLRDFLFGYN